MSGAVKAPCAIAGGAGPASPPRRLRGAAARGPARRLLDGGGTLLLYALVPVLIVVAWALYASANPADLAGPWAVVKRLWEWAVHGDLGLGDYYRGSLLEAIGASLVRVLGGFAIAAVLGVALGILIGWFGWARKLLDPTIQVLRPVPLTAWLPLAIVFFGLTNRASIFLIALGAFYPIVVNTAAGVRRVERDVVRAALALGASRAQLVRLVVVPASLPSIFDGLRIGLGFAWMLVILSEMFAVHSGLGYALWDAYNLLRTDAMLAAMLTVGLVGFLFDRLLLALRHRLLRWSSGRTAGA